MRSLAGAPPSNFAIRNRINIHHDRKITPWRAGPVHAIDPRRQHLPTRVRLFIDALRTVVEPMTRLPR
jgi:hypothetical protein